MSMWIKEFSAHRVVITDGKEDHVLTANAPNEFDRDILEDILSYPDRVPAPSTED